MASDKPVKATISDTTPQDAPEHQAADKPRRSIWKWTLIVVGVLIAAAVVVVILVPSPIDPVAYTPPPKPELAGALGANDLLRSAEIITRGKVEGPEDVGLDAEGRIYTGTLDGRIVRILPDGTHETFATTGGRPIGLDFDADGNLIVCDGSKGLLQVAPDGGVTTLVGRDQVGMADDVDVASDGMIYFSDASDKFALEEYTLDFMEGRPHGRLLAYDPSTGQLETLLDNLYFANGVAVANGGEFVLVNETFRYRVTRYWLTGEKAGTSDTFAENLPGFPDGISASPRGTFWVAIFTLRNDMADWLATRPFLRGLLAKLPQSSWPQPEPYGLVLELDAEGNVVRSLHDEGGRHVSLITSVEEHEGAIYLGTLLHDWIARMDVPAP